MLVKSLQHGTCLYMCTTQIRVHTHANKHAHAHTHIYTYIFAHAGEGIAMRNLRVYV